MTVTSHGARRVRLALRATLPPGGAIRFFHGSPPRVVGTMDRNDVLSGGPGLRWSPSVPGSTIGLELTLPSSDARAGTVLEIDRVAHHLETTSDEEECRPQFLACTEPWRWRPVADAVARIRFERPDGSYQCSGTLLNDTDENSFVPYLITANHCISTQAEAETVEAEWFYRPPACGLGQEPFGRSTPGGADLLATDFASDSTLLRLKGPDWEGVDEHGRQVPASACGLRAGTAAPGTPAPCMASITRARARRITSKASSRKSGTTWRATSTDSHVSTGAPECGSRSPQARSWPAAAVRDCSGRTA